MRTQSSPLLAVALGWLASWTILSATTLIGPILLLLPNGSPPSSALEARCCGCQSLSVALASFTFAFAPGPLRALQTVDNPIALSSAGPLLDQLHAIAAVLIPLGFVLAAVSLVGRFRGARGEERQQLKWITSGALVWMVAYDNRTGSLPRVTQGYVYLLAFASFVAALAFAILRYRLYDIDLVINRPSCTADWRVHHRAVRGGDCGRWHAPSAARRTDVLLSLLATALVAAAFQPAAPPTPADGESRFVYGQRIRARTKCWPTSPTGIRGGVVARRGACRRMAEAAAQGVGAATRTEFESTCLVDRIGRSPGHPQAAGDPSIEPCLFVTRPRRW